MNVTELAERLLELSDEYGDIEVCTLHPEPNSDSHDYKEVDEVTIVKLDGDAKPLILLE